MSSWIKILSLVFLLGSPDVWSCRLRDKFTGIYSLSGPVTVALRELGLLKDTRLKGISIFHPVPPGEFPGEVLPGGVFLSREVARRMEGGLIFFDESRELARMFGSLKATGIKFKSRGLAPLEVVKKVSEVLLPHTEGCEKKVQALLMKSREISAEILKLTPKGFRAVFFLGPFRNGNPADMAMVNDGVVKWLKAERKLETYPTELAYVSWSSKVMAALPSGAWKVGVADSGNRMVKKLERLGGKNMNFTYPGALIPGFSQLEAWLFLMRSL